MNAGNRCANDSTYKHLPGLIPGEEIKLVFLHPNSVSTSSTNTTNITRINRNSKQ